EWVHVQLHQQKGMISLSPPTICNSALRVAQLSNPGNGKKQVFPAPGVSITENHTISQFKSH
ncbi:hypothetical protein ACQ93L_23955, partial [Escherichia coli]